MARALSRAARFLAGLGRSPLSAMAYRMEGSLAGWLEDRVSRVWIMREYLTVAELAELFGLTPKTVRNRMHDGTWRRGEHWFHPPGIGPRFRWSAMRLWLESDRPAPETPGAAFGPDIPRARRGRRPHQTLT